jgi:S1-C subfamily serine protease
MAIKITYPAEIFGGKTLSFDDSVEDVRIGRRAGNEVSFPPELTAVGGSHFALRRELSTYKFVIAKEYPVFLNGRPVVDGQEVPERAELRLGKADGPRLKIERLDAGGTNLPPTEILAGGRDAGDLALAAEQTAQRQGRGLLAVAAGIALVAVAGAALYFGLQSDVSNVAQKVDTVSQQVVQATKDLPELKARVETIDAKTMDAAALVARFKDSVYQVQIQLASGTRMAGGTASVVKLPDGTLALATNAHVAEIIKEFDTVPMLKGAKLVAVQPKGPEYQVLTVTGTKVHPGYAPFGAFMEAQGAARATGSTSDLNLIPGYDVALLFVDQPEKLGAPLAYAPPGDLAKLRAGEPLLMIGYPVEKMDSIDVSKPVPVSQTGRITSMTDFFLETLGSDSDLLVQHSVPATGGASGSPLFNTKGEVVAFLNAGSIDVVVGASGNLERSPLAALVNFAQRADLLTELAEGKADARLAALTAEMERKRADWTKAPDVYLKDSRLMMANEAGSDEKIQVLADGVSLKMDQPWEGEGNKPVASFDLAYEKAGGYLIVVSSKDKRDVRMSIVSETGELLGVSEGLAANTRMFGYFGGYETFPIKHKAMIADLSGKDVSGEVTVTVLFYPEEAAPEGTQ